MVRSNNSDLVAEFNTTVDFVADVRREANHCSIDELKPIDVVITSPQEFVEASRC